MSLLRQQRPQHTDDKNSDALRLIGSSSLLKNLEIESFLFLDGGCWGGAVELYGIFSADVGCTLTRGG
jgi:hypothetical protein